MSLARRDRAAHWAAWPAPPCRAGALPEPRTTFKSQEMNARRPGPLGRPLAELQGAENPLPHGLGLLVLQLAAVDPDTVALRKLLCCLIRPASPPSLLGRASPADGFIFFGVSRKERTSRMKGISDQASGILRDSSSSGTAPNKLRFWLSAFLSRTTEGDVKLRQKQIKSAVGAHSVRPVRHRRTICRRQIRNCSHPTSVWIVCSRKRCLLRKRRRTLCAPTACLLSYDDNQKKIFSK